MHEANIITQCVNITSINNRDEKPVEQKDKNIKIVKQLLENRKKGIEWVIMNNDSYEYL